MGLTHVFRRLLKSPLFTIVTLLTLAIGIGANAAIFGVIEGVLLKPLPYPQAEGLISLDHRAPGVKLESVGMAPFLYFTYREQNRTLQDIAVWQNNSVSITGLAEPEQVDAVNVTDGVLPILGAKPALGRLFTRKDDAPGSPKTAIITYGYWQNRFGRDPSVIGRRILVDSQPHEIIGVLPASFRFMDLKLSLLLPMQFDRSKTFLGNFSYRGLARLKPGVTLTQAQADAARMIPLAIDGFPPHPGFSSKMFSEARMSPKWQPLKQELLGDIGSVLWILMGTIGIVLLIACANVANLMLVRTEGRQQELAIRAALGAGWGRIARDLVVESLALAAAGGALGLGLAYAALRGLVALEPSNLPRIDEISIDGPVLLFTFGASLLAGLLFGAIPVFKYAGPRLATALRAGGRTLGQSRERHRARNTLVVVQVALALLLLIGSGLMIRTFQTLRNVHPGFSHPEQLQTARYYLPPTQVPDEAATVRMHQNILQKVAAVPGVTAAGLTSNVPIEQLRLARPHLRPGSRLRRIAIAAAAPVQVRLAWPAEDHGQSPGRRSRLHLDRRVRKTARRAAL